jgi:recombination protein RecT
MQDAKELSKSIVAEAMQKSLVPSTQKPKPRDIKTAIQEMRPLLQQALPKHLTADRVIQMATNYVRQNPAIAKCTEQSLLGAIMQASVLGLEPVQALGQVYFVPYKANKGTREQPQWVDEIQFQIGYKGLIKLAHNTNKISMIYAKVRYENDQFEYEEGMEPKLYHKPAEGNRGKFVGAYAVVHYMNGAKKAEYLSKEDIERLRNLNKMQKNGINGAWATHYEKMAKIKALKQLLSLEPLSPEIEAALYADEKIITEKAFRNDQGGIDLDAIEQDEVWTTEYEPTNESEAQIAV